MPVIKPKFIMGFGLEYKCRNCNYTKSFFVGCGLATTHENWMPAVNKSLKEMVSVNTWAPIADPENIIPYTNLILNRKPFFRFTPENITWGWDELPTKYNYCPKCGKYKMTCKKDGWLFD